MAMIKSFRDLGVYKLGLAEAKRLFLVTKTFPNEERYLLPTKFVARRVPPMGW
jgi:hypothetical protein